MKDSSWLKKISHSNSLYARATRAITNHASIEEYRLRFFPRENFSCLCRTYSIESRHQDIILFISIEDIATTKIQIESL